MKVILFAFLLLAFVVAQSPELIQCIEKQCPNEFNKCKKTSGCEDKLKKCAAKCGQKVAQTCWTLCLGLPGAAADTALCAVNKGCISKVSVLDRVGLTLMQAIKDANVESQ